MATRDLPGAEEMAGAATLSEDYISAKLAECSALIQSGILRQGPEVVK